mmetsp:Transcript_16904/g.38922  ORF Transcript_16904/g.38922 Transcript_16904/m.38922 type:complete len:102 (-) Transcript_16904:1044-1349(-)
MNFRFYLQGATSHPLQKHTSVGERFTGDHRKELLPLKLEPFVREGSGVLAHASIGNKPQIAFVWNFCAGQQQCCWKEKKPKKKSLPRTMTTNTIDSLLVAF